MSDTEPALLLFTDVDGCLVNKHDYSYAAAVPALKRLRSLSVPVILSSSKTAAELMVLAEELQLHELPLICENGARILWRGTAFGGERSTVTGTSRAEFLPFLQSLKSSFRFRSFTDLGLDGVMQATDLDEESARRAMEREGTEPLLWDDDAAATESFRRALEAEGLTLTRGGRFWHVAGTASKGDAMLQVDQAYQSKSGRATRTIAVGDSPIDQSMLDRADLPVGIPAPDGSRNVRIAEQGLWATLSGAAGWRESVDHLLDRFAPTA